MKFKTLCAYRLVSVGVGSTVRGWGSDTVALTRGQKQLSALWGLWYQGRRSPSLTWTSHYASLALLPGLKCVLLDTSLRTLWGEGRRQRAGSNESPLDTKHI